MYKRMLEAKYADATDKVAYWKEIGLIKNDETEETSQEVTKYYNELAEFIINTKSQYSYSTQVISFALIYRCIKNNGGLIQCYTPKKLCDVIESTYTNMISTMRNVLSDGDLDEEAEYANLIAYLFGKNK